MDPNITVIIGEIMSVITTKEIEKAKLSDKIKKYKTESENTKIHEDTYQQMLDDIINNK